MVNVGDLEGINYVENNIREMQYGRFNEMVRGQPILYIGVYDVISAII